MDPLQGLLVGGAALLGLLVGSFLNVVVWRVPRGESVVHPPSACPACGHRVRAADNVPLLSWMLLRGRCRDCRTPISARYPLVEAATAVLFGVTAAWTGLSWALPVYLYLGAVAVALALIDLDVRRLPDAIVLPSYGVVGLLLLLATAAEGDWTGLLRAATGAIALYLLYFALAVARPGGMGWGDVKLSGVLGMVLAWHSWSALAVGAFAAFLLGGVIGLALIAARRADRSSGLPFGPFMLAGAGLGLVIGAPIVQWYLGIALA